VPIVCAANPTEDVKTNGCHTICTLQYEPICAANAEGTQRTFSNECAMGVENCVKKTSKIIHKNI
jgi:hypothetical protein